MTVDDISRKKPLFAKPMVSLRDIRQLVKLGKCSGIATTVVVTAQHAQSD